MTYRPPANVTLHDGKEVPWDMELFCTPGAEVGRVLSVHSTLRKNEQPIPIAVGFVVATLLAGLLVGLCVAIAYFSSNDREILWIGAKIGGFFATGIWVATIFMFRFDQLMTVVGEKGLMEVRIRWSRNRKPRVETFLFKDADNLYTDMIRQSIGPVSDLTTMALVWRNARRKGIWNMMHRRRDASWGAMYREDGFNYGLAAEKSWSRWRWNLIMHQIEMGGDVKFKLTALGVIENGVFYNLMMPRWLVFDYGEILVKPGSLEVTRLGREKLIIDASNFKATVQNGVILFERNDARPSILKRRALSIPYKSVANAELFLVSLEEIFGTKVGE